MQISSPLPPTAEQMYQDNPVSILKSLSGQKVTGKLRVRNNGVDWSIFLDQGQILYITHNLEPLARLIEQVQRLQETRSVVVDQVRSLLNPMFNAQGKAEDPGQIGYDALLWLVHNKHLTPEQGQEVCERLTHEALESLLLTTEAETVFRKEVLSLPQVHAFDLSFLLDHGHEQIRGWQALVSPVFSPNQRLYLTSQGTTQQQLPELSQQLRTLLRGLSFRNLAGLTRMDTLRLAQGLLPDIREKVILLRDPQPPFNKLPRFPLLPVAVASPSCTIACVDDSPTITNEIRRCLGGSGFEVVAVNDPLKALVQITRIKPELILLDVGMPYLDGYELCRLLRKNTLFKKTPIVMVTGNTGFLDRARATMVGATDYLTKPFTQEGLLKMVHRHLAR